MRIYIFFLVIVTLLLSCKKSKVHTYYCKDCDIHFSIEEKGQEDVLIIENYDSIFFRPAHGNYLGICFYITDSLKNIYIGQNFHVSHYSEKNYKIKFIAKDHEGLDVDYPPLGKNFWGFEGGCDQGNYTFGVFHDSKYILPSLEPLEWN